MNGYVAAAHAAVNVQAAGLIAWPVLGLAIIPGVVGWFILRHSKRGDRHKPRIAAIPAALAAELILLSVRPLVELIATPVGPGPTLYAILAIFIFSACVLVVDYKRNGYTKAILHRKRKVKGKKPSTGNQSSGKELERSGPGNRSWTPPATSGAGGVQHPHPLRPTLALFGFVTGGIFSYLDWPKIMSIFTAGPGTTIQMIATRGKG